MDPQVGGRKDALTTLTRRISPIETSIPTPSTAPFHPGPNRINIEGERIRYTTTTPTSFDGCIRGADRDEGGTEGREHLGGAYITQDEPNAPALIHDETPVLKRNALALYEGAGIDLTILDNPVLERSEVTIAGFTLDHGHTASGDGSQLLSKAAILQADADLLSVDAFTAVASVIINARNVGSGDLFQSDYDHYQIIVHLTALSSTTSVNFYFRLRTAGGADSGAAVHYSNRISGQADAATPVGASVNGGGSCCCAVITAGAAAATWDLKIWGPNTTHFAKRFNSQFSWSANTSGHGIAGGQVTDATQFVGIKFLPDSMNLTGTAWTFGIRKAA